MKKHISRPKLRHFYLLFLFAALVSCQAKAGGNNDSLGDQTTETVAKERNASLIFFGDAMQHQAQLDRAKALGQSNKTYDFTECFDLIAPIVKGADYAVVNLEVPLGGGPDYSGYPCFSAPDSYAEELKKAGFDMYLTANNHCLDRRDKGARKTIETLDRLGLDHIGTYKNAADRAKLVPFIKEINGIKVGMLNYTYGTNGIEPRDGVEVSLIDRKKMAEEMKATRDAGAELLVVTVHWGIEYELRQNKSQEDLADFLIDNGADLIIGSHPHVIQPMEVKHNAKEDKDVLVVYSLGNMISNMTKTPDMQGGAYVVANVGTDGKGRVVFKNAEYDTFYSAKPAGGTTNFRVYPRSMTDKIPASQKSKAEMFYRNSAKIFDSKNVNVPRVGANVRETK